MSSSTIIIGGGDLIEVIHDNINKLAPFRRQPFLDIYARYKANENSVTLEQQLFVLRCGEDVLDHH